jgi:hypothetical protein
MSNAIVLAERSAFSCLAHCRSRLAASDLAAESSAPAINSMRSLMEEVYLASFHFFCRGVIASDLLRPPEADFCVKLQKRKSSASNTPTQALRRAAQAHRFFSRLDPHAFCETTTPALFLVVGHPLRRALGVPTLERSVPSQRRRAFVSS